MLGYVAPTDRQWFDFLAARAPHDEVNFWTPSGRGFAALKPGQPFFFKLKSPETAIGGFGIFTRAQILPLWLAWESFGEGNGVGDERTLVERIAANRPSTDLVLPSTRIGCRLLSEPVFLPRELWVEAPRDWSRPIVSGKSYDLTAGEGLRVWRECLERAEQLRGAPSWVEEAGRHARYGQPRPVRPRLGQGGFRLAVLDAYDGACCVTSEHSLPVLEAAHIRPYAAGGEHSVSNGLPLRRDLHRLFDLGYVTVRPDLTFLVGERLRLEYHNGRSYYELHGSKVRVPHRRELRPSPEALEWHNEMVFRAS